MLQLSFNTTLLRQKTGAEAPLPQRMPIPFVGKGGGFYPARAGSNSNGCRSTRSLISASSAWYLVVVVVVVVVMLVGRETRDQVGKKRRSWGVGYGWQGTVGVVSWVARAVRSAMTLHSVEE